MTVYDYATENGRYYELSDVKKQGLFAWIDVIGEHSDTERLEKTKSIKIESPSILSREKAMVILLANLLGGI